MHKTFGGTGISPGGAHGFDDDSQDPGLAYSEGWGTGFMLSVCPDGMYNWHEGNTESAGEWPACTAQNDGGREIEQFADAGNRIGERNEGRVAAAINDSLDQPNDTNGSSEDRGWNSESDTNSGKSGLVGNHLPRLDVGIRPQRFLGIQDFVCRKPRRSHTL